MPLFKFEKRGGGAVEQWLPIQSQELGLHCSVPLLQEAGSSSCSWAVPPVRYLEAGAAVAPPIAGSRSGFDPSLHCKWLEQGLR